MLFLRIYLLAGLVVHKAVWEILKRRPQGSQPGAQRSSFVKLVKAVKIVILLGVAVQTLLPDILPISNEPFMFRVAGALIYTAGLLIAIRGRTELGSNWSDIETAKILNDQAVVSSGLYKL